MQSSGILPWRWSVAISVLLISLGSALGAFVYRSTTDVREALAEEVLEQQSDVANLIHEYANVMLRIEQLRLTRTSTKNKLLKQAIASSMHQLKRMRSNYSFARLDGAARAHAFAKPVLEDLEQWLHDGLHGYASDSDIILSIMAKRVNDRYQPLLDIARDTDEVSNKLVSQQTAFLDKFRNVTLLLLSAFAGLAVSIIALLIRQRNLQVQASIDKEFNAKKLIEAESRGRLLAEVALLGSKQFLSETLDSLPSQIVILNNQGNILAANSPWEKLINEGSVTINDGGVNQLYDTVYKSILHNEQDHESLDIAIRKVSEVLSGERDADYYEFPWHTKYEQKWLAVIVSTFIHDGRRHAVVAHEDITQRKLLSERDRRLRAELAHASRLTTVGEMASGLAHELNQPLTAISHNCDAVVNTYKNSGHVDESILTTLNDIYEQAQRAGKIIRGMRQLVRKDNTDMVPTDINRLVIETLRLTQPEARERGINVELRLADNLPQPTVDPVQIQQVLVNLERNSVEAMNQSDIRHLLISTQLDSENGIRISVQDTGPGIETDMHKHLFSAFQTTKASGMGLGLSISRSIVEEHGGRLWIDPRENSVTIFHFSLPIAKR